MMAEAGRLSMAPRRRPRRRWTDPATPLQAARFARRWTAQVVCDRVRGLCPGHRDEGCRIDPPKLSDLERGILPVSRAHIPVFCAVYATGPEELGLVVWRTPEQREQSERDHRAELERELRAKWESERGQPAACVAAAMVTAATVTVTAAGPRAER